MSLQSEAEFLAPVQTFAPEAFLPGPDAPANVCAFVLSLSVIYNDFKDLALADHLLRSNPPAVTEGIDAERGQYCGLQGHILRLLGGLVHELLRLTADNEYVLSDPAFTKALARCPRPSREAWDAVAAAALAHAGSDPLLKALLLLRNKISFHYDPKEIANGYRAAFSSPARYGRPCISRGITLQSSRHYFADAAAQAYFFAKTGGAAPDSLLRWDSPMVVAVNRALAEIVEAFIASRNHAFREI